MSRDVNAMIRELEAISQMLMARAVQNAGESAFNKSAQLKAEARVRELEEASKPAEPVQPAAKTNTRPSRVGKKPGK